MSSVLLALPAEITGLKVFVLVLVLGLIGHLCFCVVFCSTSPFIFSFLPLYPLLK